MNVKEFLKKNLMIYFIIVTGITAATGILGMNIDPEARFGYEAFFSPLIFGAIATIPSLILYSKRELSLKQMLLRRILHFFVLELTLIVFGLNSGLLESVDAAVSFAASVFIVYLLTNIISYIIDSKTANDINKGLKRLQG
ncbi:MAG: hypothetical protein K0S76_405 [Herbinix sp.]|jgi:hypothetical protein|nr:hypothetical protein [Herbinix sp.]